MALNEDPYIKANADFYGNNCAKYNKFYKPEGLISKIKSIEEEYKKTGVYEYKYKIYDGMPSWFFKSAIIFITILISILTIMDGLRGLFMVVIILILAFAIAYLFLKIYQKILLKRVVNLVRLENNYITFQYSDKTEKYDINDINIKYRLQFKLVWTGKTIARFVFLHLLITGETFEKWIPTGIAKLEYQALVYFIHYLKNDELDKVHSLDTDFLIC